MEDDLSTRDIVMMIIGNILGIAGGTGLCLMMLGYPR